MAKAACFTFLKMMIPLCFINSVNGQKVDSFSIKADKLFISDVEQLFLWDSLQERLGKYDLEGVLLSEVYTTTYGDLEKVDLSDPLRPALFYKTSSMIEIFDDRLANRYEVDPKWVNVFQVGGMSRSRLGGFILFDSNQNQLIRLDQQANEIFRSSDLYAQVGNYLNPQDIFEYKGNIYLLDTSGILYEFSSQFQYLRQISVEDFLSFQWWEGRLYLYSKKSIKYISLLDMQLQQSTIQLKGYEIDSYGILGRSLYFLDRNRQLYRVPILEVLDGAEGLDSQSGN